MVSTRAMTRSRIQEDAGSVQDVPVQDVPDIQEAASFEYQENVEYSIEFDHGVAAEDDDVLDNDERT